MRAGLLRDRVLVLVPVSERDAYGAVVKQWQTRGPYPMQIEELAADELVQAKQIHAAITAKVRLRRLPLITPDCRLRDVSPAVTGFEAVHAGSEDELAGGTLSSGAEVVASRAGVEYAIHGMTHNRKRTEMVLYVSTGKRTGHEA